jgi:hypothetical protein
MGRTLHDAVQQRITIRPIYGQRDPTIEFFFFKETLGSHVLNIYIFLNIISQNLNMHLFIERHKEGTNG